MNRMKNEPQRTCVVCRQTKDKKELLRIVCNASGEIMVDSTGKANGRGAYICKNEECLAMAKKKKCLDRAFKRQVGEEIYGEVEIEIGKTK